MKKTALVFIRRMAGTAFGAFLIMLPSALGLRLGHLGDIAVGAVCALFGVLFILTANNR